MADDNYDNIRQLFLLRMLFLVVYVVVISKLDDNYDNQ